MPKVVLTPLLKIPLLDPSCSKDKAKNKEKEEIHEVVHNTIVDVVKTPKTELVKKEKKKLHTLPILSEEKKKEIQLKKALSLFS